MLVRAGKFVAEDIDALGCRRLETIDGRVLFEGGPEAVARANINLRCAERVLIRLGAFAPTASTRCSRVRRRCRGSPLSAATARSRQGAYGEIPPCFHPRLPAHREKSCRRPPFLGLRPCPPARNGREAPNRVFYPQRRGVADDRYQRRAPP
ncbi:MAG: hypothetical protein ACLUFV_00735 [Acutalibacteraceae bacterium]